MSKPLVQVAIAILLHQGKVLVGWRQAEQHQGNKHEFPGGKVEAGETPEQASLREAQEEAGLTLLRLELVARSYPSPGISTEFFHQYIGITSLPETTNLVSGLASEAEDIRSHIFYFPDFLRMIEEGQILVGPAILLDFWLAQNRDKLRAVT